MRSTFFLVLLTIISVNIKSTFAQEGCKVLKPEIAGKYEGKCKNGLAHGKGIAEGQDKYIGKFKNGLPHGDGKYIWSSGEIYEGGWRDGKKEGEGKFYYKKDGTDSVKIGIWKNDAFYKKIKPTPYKVLRTVTVSRYSVHRVGDGQKVVITIMQNGSPTSSYSNLQITTSSGNSFTSMEKLGYENIIFPFTCKLTLEMPNSFRTASHNVEFEIEITEPGSWEISING